MPSAKVKSTPLKKNGKYKKKKEAKKPKKAPKKKGYLARLVDSLRAKFGDSGSAHAAHKSPKYLTEWRAARGLKPLKRFFYVRWPGDEGDGCGHRHASVAAVADCYQTIRHAHKYVETTSNEALTDAEYDELDTLTS